ncbi:hypothetical protein HMPREF1531_00622 [Propionibacterium sp. oral taxon 192 str. F0372]|uniref:glycosyltransferase n=1 Tax=Propionibacterium sp. oral taxon 192 TaxID=671222 RepID=UPI00035342D0|nr:glycosyltransferase [Propionibacterium sp. oral taxon 192]EPH05974.1 hypothetical protein HMPREF1531_00622 [Propionibacterium sp. oral taxon 192 str. F0372]
MSHRSATDHPLHVVMVSMHTSPLSSPGRADAGGMNVVELNSALALAKAGHRVDILTRRDDDLPGETRIADGVRVIRLDAGPPAPVAKSAQEALINPFAEALGRWLSAEGADVVHSHHWFSGMAAVSHARGMGVPHLQSFHSVAAPLGADLGEGEQPESPGRARGEAFAAQASDGIVAVSSYEAATVKARYGVEDSRITVVYPGVDLGLFAPATPATPPRLVFAARLQPLKDPGLAIQALAHMPGDTRLVIAGEASDDFAGYAESLHQLVHRLGVQERIDFHESLPREALAELFASATVLVNPSHSETFGLINLEAQACGVPVVATRTGGMPESLVEGISGVLMDSREPFEWAHELQRFVDDPGLRARYGAAGRQFAARRPWRVVADELVAVYRGAIR